MKIICESCGTIFPAQVIQGKTTCPVCGASFDDLGIEESKDVQQEEHAGWITWYYYGQKDENGNKVAGILRNATIDLDKLGDRYYLIKEFKAPPESECGLDEVKRILRKYVPDAFAETPSVPKVRCPYCRSTEIQLVPRKFSLLTGFATNKYDRMCIRCKRKF